MSRCVILNRFVYHPFFYVALFPLFNFPFQVLTVFFVQCCSVIMELGQTRVVLHRLDQSFWSYRFLNGELNSLCKVRQRVVNERVNGV